MAQALHTAPVCEKHGCEKKWSKDKSRKAGGRWRCLACKREESKEQYWANPKKSIACTLRWAKANPKRKAATSFRWAEANPEKIVASTHKWTKANPEKRKEACDRWKEENPEKVKAQGHRHRARLRNATVPGQPVTAAAIAERLALFDGCAYCDADKKLTIDHFVALNNGGLHVASNLVGACGCCNSSKQDKPVEEWFKSQSFFSVERWERLNEITCA